MTLPSPSIFEAYVESQTTLVASPGTSVTPGVSNAMGTEVQVLTTGAWSGVTGPGYEIEIEIYYGTAGSGVARDTLVTIMKDDAGGTNPASASDWIVHLSAAQASRAVDGICSIIYRFPVTVPNGCSLFAKAQVNKATSEALRVMVRIACEPTKPWTLRTGTAVVTLGDNAAASNGTAITAGGTGADPAWTEIATLGADICFIDYGWCVDDTTLQQAFVWVDLAVGASGSERIAVNNGRMWTSALEMISKPAGGVYCDAASGEKVFARVSRSNGTLDSNESIIIYAVTGRYTPPNTHTVAGTVTIAGAAAPNGEDVQIIAIDDDGIPELVTTVQTSGGTGAFTASVPDNTRDYFAKYDDGTNRGVSALDTPV